MSTDERDLEHRAKGSGRPARGYSWPPFERGHTLSLRHGAFSSRQVQPMADAFTAELRATAAWASSPAFRGTVESWAWAESQAHLLRKYLDDQGHLDAEGEELPAVRTLDRVEGRLAKLRDQLGLTPAALAKLLATAAAVATATGDHQSLPALQAEGRRILDSRFGAPDTDDGDVAEGGTDVDA